MNDAVDGTESLLLKIKTAVEVSHKKMAIFEDQTVHLPKVCVYENVREFNENFADHLLRDIYIQRSISFPPIDIIDFPSGVAVHGDCDWITTFDGCLISEQFHSPIHSSIISKVQNSKAPEIYINDDAILLARYGSRVWGHWAGELVPRGIIAEFAAPGKYKFVVPIDIFESLHNNFLSILEAYGINRDRMIPLDRDHRYVFSRLATVSSMWIYPYAMSPAAQAIVRNKFKVTIPRIAGVNPKAALMRTRGSSRTISNSSEIVEFLASRDYSIVQVGDLPFIHQGSIFQQAQSIFGELGSNLTGLMYSPLKVGVVSIAPTDWGDCFFHGLIQGVAGKYADLRGNVDPGYVGTTHMAPFSVAVSRISEALELFD